MNALKPRFQSILKELSPKLTTTDVEQIDELANVGELAVAFENFCTQLYERDAVCSVVQVQEIGLIGTALGIKEKYWTILATE